MKHSEKTFQVLDTLDREEISTQRQLADHSGISLGQVNYILKSLLSRGLVKLGNFRKNPNKIGYAYLLTPKGIETKSRLAVKFVMVKLKEYNRLRERLAYRLTTIEENGYERIVFVGPLMMKEFIDSIIKERDLNLVLVSHYADLKEMDDIAPGSFDIILLFEDISENFRELEENLKTSRDRILTLW